VDGLRRGTVVFLHCLFAVSCSREGAKPAPAAGASMPPVVALPLARTAPAEAVVVSTPAIDSFSVAPAPSGRYVVRWELALGPAPRQRPPQLDGTFESQAKITPYFNLYPGDELRLSVQPAPAWWGKAAVPWRFVLRPETLKVEWAHADEESWIVATIARDVAEMLRYAAGSSPPAGKDLDFSVKADPGPGSSGPRYAVTVSVVPGVPVTVPLTFTDHLFAPDSYLPLASELAHALALTLPPGSGESRILDVLLDPRSSVLERESQRVSRRLAETMLEPTAHEEAALVLGALALREAAGARADTRHTLCRMAAHLTMARVARGEGGSALGRYGDAALRTLVRRQADALERIAALERERKPLPGGAAWLRTLRIRNTSDWRVLAKPVRASLLERLEHYRALQDSLGASAATTFLRSFPAERMSDWARVAFQGASVEQGNLLGPDLIRLELLDAAETWQAYHGKAAPADVAEALNSLPERLLVLDDAGRTTPRVIGWGVWARFFQRNLRFEAWSWSRFASKTLGTPEAARAFRQAAIEPLSRLDVFPLELATWAQAIESGGKAMLEGTPQDLAKLRHETCEKAVPPMKRSPELLPAEIWVQAEDACIQEMQRQPLSPRWFTTPVPFGTGLLDTGRRVVAARAKRDVPALFTAVHSLAPFDASLVRALAAMRELSFEEKAKLFGPLADYDVAAMVDLARTRAADPALVLPIYAKATAINPDYFFELGHYLVDLDRDGEAVVAYEKGIRLARDRVRASNSVLWLVGHYCDEGRLGRAREVAEMAAEVYSGQGLATMGYLMERLGRYDEARDWYQKIVERYDDRDEIDAFYVRYDHRVGDGRFRAETDAAMRRLFPRGLERVSLPGLKPPPQRSPDEVVVGGRSWRSTRFGLAKDDLVVALNGYRVRNDDQYQCLWTFDDDSEAAVIVWREGRFLEIKGRMKVIRYDPLKHRV
jgi:tetratricopeptide (TPR) repeat protein